MKGACATLSATFYAAWAVLLGVVAGNSNEASAAVPTPPLEAITFAVEPGALYLTLEEAAQALQWPVTRDAKGRCLQLNDAPLLAASLRHLTDGTELVSMDDVARIGHAAVQNEEDLVLVSAGGRTLRMVVGAKHVEVNLALQNLRAWQGSRLVLQSRISSGRHGSTPRGDFAAGPYKARMHYSKLFDHAPMPWSVQISGHVFVHGFSSVPSHPASHGCIRLPLDEGNPAKFFYEWIDVGTPVRVLAK